MEDPQVPRFKGFDERSDVFVFVTFDINDVIDIGIRRQRSIIKRLEVIKEGED